MSDRGHIEGIRILDKGTGIAGLPRGREGEGTRGSGLAGKGKDEAAETFFWKTLMKERMKMKRTLKGHLRPATVMAAVLVAGCNINKQLPPGSKVIVEPNSRTIHITELRDDNNTCIWDDNNYLDIPVTLWVLNSEDKPIGDTEVAIYVDWSGNTFSGVEALKLYDDRNGNGIVEDPEELVSGAGEGIFTTKTSRYNGDKRVLLRINLSCKFQGRLIAVSGGQVGGLDIDITTKGGGAE